MRIDHIGYAVKDIEKAQKAMGVLGYEFEPVIRDEARNIFISFGKMSGGGYKVELVAPISEKSPVDGYLQKIGAAPYHICYQSDDIEADIQRLQKAKYRVSVPLTPAAAFGGKRVVFLYSLSAGLVELVEITVLED